MDIIERLENRIRDAPMLTEHLLDDAKAEIERLRADNEQLRTALLVGSQALSKIEHQAEELRGYLQARRSVSNVCVILGK